MYAQWYSRLLFNTYPLRQHCLRPTLQLHRWQRPLYHPSEPPPPSSPTTTRERIDILPHPSSLAARTHWLHPVSSMQYRKWAVLLNKKGHNCRLLIWRTYLLSLLSPAVSCRDHNVSMCIFIGKQVNGCHPLRPWECAGKCVVCTCSVCTFNTMVAFFSIFSPHRHIRSHSPSSWTWSSWLWRSLVPPFPRTQ